ncbi:MAG: DUF11 domain-containing protein [Euryarchaeota archaeon]|nr:DUF11 domain-containing protein [Euryarchaeota archaeon]
MSKWVWFILASLLSIPVGYALCPEPTEVLAHEFRGYADRTSGGIVLSSLGGSFLHEDFNVSVSRVFDNRSIEVRVLRNGADYLWTSVETGEHQELRRPDILIKLNSADKGNNSANISVYTPYWAKLTVNITNFRISAGTKAEFLPEEQSFLEFSLINTGELAAENLTVTPLFGDFQILDKEPVKTYPFLCGFNDTLSKVMYSLKAPAGVRGSFNYSMILKLDYTAYNVQSDTKTQYTDYYLINATIAAPVVSVERSVSNWTLGEFERLNYPKIRVTINNGAPMAAIFAGNESVRPSDPEPRALNIEWQDPVEPEFTVEGTTSWKGDLANGTWEEFSYRLRSSEPIMCSYRSKVTYQDKYGSKYVAFSSNKTMRFAPFLALEKDITSTDLGYAVVYIDPTTNKLNENVVWSINQTEWLERGNISVLTDVRPNVTINRTASVKVRIKNRGNTIARGVVAREEFDGLAVTGGPTQWSGDLPPGEEATYGFDIRVTRPGQLTFKTNISYLDANVSRLLETSEIESRSLSFCVKDLVNVSLNQTIGFNGLYPGLFINRTYSKVLADEIDYEQGDRLRALAGFEFDYNLTILNNGSDAMHDIITTVEILGMKASEFGGPLVRGAPVIYLKELEAKYFGDLNTTRSNMPNVTYNYTFLLPDLERDTNFTMITTVTYKDFFGDIRTKNISTTLKVLIPREAYLRLASEGENFFVALDYANETNLGEYGSALLKFRTTEFATRGDATLTLAIPQGIELATNSSQWTGKTVRTMRKGNETWYVFTGNVSWAGSMGPKEELRFQMLITGVKSGLYKIPFVASFGRQVLGNAMDLKVKGAILEITKAVEKSTVDVGEEVGVVVKVRNLGEDAALEVVVKDEVPAGLEAKGTTVANTPELKPGGELLLRYSLRSKKEGLFTLGKGKVQWADRLGQTYTGETREISLEVGKVAPPPPVKSAEELELTKVQLALVILFLVAIIGAVFRVLFRSMPSLPKTKEEK